MPWPPATSLLAPLTSWFGEAHRDMPWRAADLDAPHPDPYAVLVSELMLQQTQVSTVIPYFTRWMRQFPTPATLAEADEDTVHKAWEGLGYYRRARYLKAAATSLVAEGWPCGLEGLRELPGLGPYTAAAVGAIAFQWPCPALDGNAFRVLARVLLIEGDPKRKADGLRTWLVPALEAQGPSRLTQALMELGATVCTPSPDCPACPLASVCQANRKGRTSEIPPIARRPTPTAQSLWLLAIEAEGHFLLHSPSPKGLLAGLWRWPTVQEDSQQRDGDPEGDLRAWPGWTQVYTHRREAVRPLHLQLPARFPVSAGLGWVPADGLAALPLGNRDQRLRNLLPTPGQTPTDAPTTSRLLAQFQSETRPA